MKKSKDKQLWKFHAEKEGGGETIILYWCKEPRRTTAWKIVSSNPEAVSYGYKLMKIDKGEVVEA